MKTPILKGAGFAAAFAAVTFLAPAPAHPMPRPFQKPVLK